MCKSDYLIIGSGPSGIGTALGLEKNYIVLESSNEVGGFSISIEISGAIFDFGGHSFHTPHPEIKELVYNSLEMFEQKRDARCYHDGIIIPYPFQTNFRALSNMQTIQECIIGMEVKDDGKNSAHFEEFIIRRFGAGIAKHFLLPYNQKLWGRDLKRLSADWTGERVAAPEGITEKFDTQGGHRKPLQSDTYVAYPAKGGYGEIFKSLGNKLRNIKLKEKVVGIDYRNKLVYTAYGKVYGYKYLISTIPLTDLVNVINGVPTRLIENSINLNFISLKLGLVVVNHQVDTDIQRIYSAEDHIPGHKIVINHNSSDYLRKLPKHGIMMEISEGPEKKLYRQDIEQWIIESLIDIGLIKGRNDVEKVVILNAKYAYPVPTHNRDSIVKEIQDWLNQVSIYSVGRFGQWAYINSDEALYRGLKIGREIAGS